MDYPEKYRYTYNHFGRVGKLYDDYLDWCEDEEIEAESYEKFRDGYWEVNRED